jgi:hypothetical protein
MASIMKYLEYMKSQLMSAIWKKDEDKIKIRFE